MPNIKDLSIELAQSDVERFARSAAYTGQELKDWVLSVLSAASDHVLAFENIQQETASKPQWASELPDRAYGVVKNAGVQSKEELKAWFCRHSESDIRALPNSGRFVYEVLSAWVKNA